MLDIAWSELMVIAVVALVFIGPKDLPKAIFTLGKWVRKARLVARDFQGHLDQMVREAELDDLRQEALKARDLNLKKMVENTIDPTGQMRSALDVGLTGKPLDPTPSPQATVVDPPVTVGQPELLAPEPIPERAADFAPKPVTLEKAAPLTAAPEPVSPDAAAGTAASNQGPDHRGTGTTGTAEIDPVASGPVAKSG